MTPATPRTWSTEIVTATHCSGLFVAGSIEPQSEGTRPAKVIWLSIGVGEHAVDQDLPGRVVRHGHLVGDDALVGDRRLRLELRGDLGVDDLVLLHGLATAQTLLDVRLDLQDVDFSGAVPGRGYPRC